MINNSFLFKEEEYSHQSIDVICPVCKSQDSIHIPHNILKKVGLITISIPKDSICEHHFQVFIDKDFKVRGYQKVDFEFVEELKGTYFYCQLCNAKVSFNINDENSYLKREPYSTHFGKDLSSYRVAHYFKDELHVNTILVDDAGVYQDHLNSNRILIKEHVEKEQPSLQFFKYTRGDQEPLESHLLFSLFTIFNTFNHWLFELVCTSQFNSLELTNLLYQKAKEASIIYTKTPDYLKIVMADKVFHLWFSNSNVICISLINELHFQWINPIIKDLVNIAVLDEDLIARSPRILILNEFLNIDSITKNDLPLINRIIYDDFLHTKTQIKYIERLPRIIKRLSEDFTIESEILISFFKQNRSVIEFLKKCKTPDYLPKFIKIIDFVNRRRLLS